MKYLFQNFWSCPQAYPGGGCRRKLSLDVAVDFLSKIWLQITTVSFVSAFIFVLIRKPADVYKHVLMGPKHNLVNFKYSWWCLLIKSWSSFQHLYAGKRCYGNPISTFPHCYSFCARLVCSGFLTQMGLWNNCALCTLISPLKMFPMLKKISFFS